MQPDSALPNIVYLHSHDTGRVIRPYGFAVDTPQLENFARQGVVFRQAHCAAPTCSPSRAALLTGQYPHQNGMTGLVHRGSRLTDPSHHLANFLTANGYRTALAGIEHVTDRSNPENLRTVGYQHHLTPEPPPDGVDDIESRHAWYARAATEFLASADPGKPFFLDCGFFITHRVDLGHSSRDKLDGDPRYVRPPSPLPDTPETRQDFADFCVAVSRLDEAMGSVLSALEAAGLTDNTLVIITTDHGIAFPQMKCNLTAHGTGVMLMMRGPMGISGGKVVDGLVSHLDVFPTICEVAGLPAPDWLEGHSLLPLVRGEAEIRESLFAEVNWHASPEPMRSVRTQRFNYIHRFNPQDGPVLPNCDDSLSKTVLRKAGWDLRAQAAEALYDLTFDPSEVANVADDPAYAEVLAVMRSRLRTWMTETADPLLFGHMAPWPGSTQTPVTEDSPHGARLSTEPIVCQAGI